MIAIVYPELYEVSGIARYVDSFLANLPQGASPLILIAGDEFRSPRNYQGVEIIHVPFSSGRFNLFVWGLRVRRALEDLHGRGRIKAVNFHWPPLIPGLFLPSEIPIVLTAHTTYLGMSGRFYAKHHYKSQWSRGSVAIKMWMERRILGKTARVIALTEQGRAEVLRYGFQKPITVIPNGADTQRFKPDRSVAKDIDVLFCGRIELRKGSRAMVEVCKRLVAARPSIRICIVGYGDDDAFVQNELGGLSANIALTGKVPFDSMVEYYNRSRLYASTSYYEGLPGTCLEAMAMELPVVVWDFAFYSQLVTEDRTGSMAPPNDFETLSRKILRLLDDPSAAATMGEAGRALLESRYSWKELSSQILQELEAV